MAFDTKQKRGSIIGVSLPFRQWLAEPIGAFSGSERLSLLKLSSTPLASPVATDPFVKSPTRAVLVHDGRTTATVI
jgi:hypothetical protein